ncbi:MAG: Trehalose/maltose import ATP-binding protein MalK [Methanomassiliicoccales archaeon PtaU1.Bin124]|nr:MAG: Trehalose/maltose import ATP-binding protein MalK [Methanomassiliicoccales archaeon PtaU1.Bin124]
MRELRKTFGKVKAVDGVSFEIEKGEMFGLLGPNGAGKTTTIRMLTGIFDPDSGVIEVDGKDMAKHKLGSKARMGIIPEIGNVYPDLTARQNLELFAQFYGIGKEERKARADRMLGDLGLKDRADDMLRGFSKGMKQRVSIGCAMVHEPDILFLDEPTEGLDVQSRRLIVDKVKELNAKGSTVLLTTHNIEEARRLCQRVCIINKGKVVAIDSPERLRSTFTEVQSVEVSFDRKVGCDLFQEKCVASATEYGDKVRIYTNDPDAVIDYLVRLKHERGLKIVSLQVLGPTLEDVFVKLTEGSR